MARMSIDDKFLRDPRVRVLAKLCGWSVRETRGALLDVWAVCYDQVTPLLSEVVIDTASELEGFTAKLIESDLGARDRSGKVRIKGAAELIAYLGNKKRAGRQGGLKSAETRSKAVKQTSSNRGSTPQAAGNPIPTPTATVPDSPSASALPPDGVTKNTDTEAAPAALVRLKSRADRKFKPTAGEAASVRVILSKLTEANGVRYTASDAHTKLIVRQLRNGCSEMDLRKVVAHCRNKWEGNDRMQEFLRPETLFGPESIQRYLDPARTEYAAYDAKKTANDHANEKPSSFILDLNAFTARTSGT